ncbi:hypothetical protein NGB58_27610, partial [Escherichia coli]|nr:hypothetical protein [Escherichia coli]
MWRKLILCQFLPGNIPAVLLAFMPLLCEPVSLKTGTYTRITGRGKDLSAHPGGKMKSRKLAVLAGILA